MVSRVPKHLRVFARDGIHLFWQQYFLIFLLSPKIISFLLLQILK